MSNLTADIQASILKAKNYVDALTIRSTHNVPKEIVSDEHKFFSWDQYFPICNQVTNKMLYIATSQRDQLCTKI